MTYALNWVGQMIFLPDFVVTFAEEFVGEVFDTHCLVSSGAVECYIVLFLS